MAQNMRESGQGCGLWVGGFAFEKRASCLFSLGIESSCEGCLSRVSKAPGVRAPEYRK